MLRGSCAFVLGTRRVYAAAHATVTTYDLRLLFVRPSQSKFMGKYERVYPVG